MDENTIVIFTSDNGGVVSGDNYSTNCAPLKAGKGYQWEGGIRVPFIINVPWLKNDGKKNDTPVAGSDFYPTLLDLAGLPLRPQNHVDGKSILPLLKGEPLAERPLYWHYPHYGNQGGRPISIIRKGDWKLIHFWEDNRNELYNLTNDIHEDNNLAGTEEQLTNEMYTQLTAWLKEVNAQYPEQDPMYDAKKEEKAIANKKKNMFESQEALRKDMLQKDWKPNDHWWGSIPTID